VKLSYVRELAKGGSRPSGKGEIIFIHGTGSNLAMWNQQVPFFLERGYNSTLVDLRGHGKTPEPGEDTSMRVHLNDVIETLEAAQTAFPAYFVGHSLGAMIAMSIAGERAELVDCVFAASLPGKILPAVVHSFNFLMKGPIQTLQASGIGRHFAWRERTLLEMREFTLKEIANQFGKMDLKSDYAQVKCPVHLAAGRFDPIAVYWEVRDIHSQMSNSTLTVFEWAGHNFMDADADKFNDWILAHMEEARPNSSVPQANTPSKPF
jgi:pimeloyl-ACP methyl ester carboxylesterase